MTNALSAQDMATSTPSVAAPKQESDDELGCMYPPWLVVIVLVVSAVIVTTAVGNVLVITSYVRDVRVRRDVYSLYLLHLALCDLLVAVVSMPLYLASTVCHLTWPLGAAMCKVFLLEDFTTCTMSTLVVVLISADRLALVRLGARYTTVHTRCRAYVMLAVCWAAAFLLYSPHPPVGCHLGVSVDSQHVCDTGFSANFYFTLVTEVLAFSVPFSLLTIINAKLLFTLRNRNKVRHSVSNAATRSRAGPGHLGNALPSVFQVGAFQESQAPNAPTYLSTRCCCTCTKKSRPNWLRSTNHEQRHKGNRVASISILLVVALAICWLPYSLATIVRSSCGDCVNTFLYEVFTWMLWLKSCVNPFLYAFISPRFRRNSLQVLLAVPPVRFLFRRR
ncbi:LOW QUALITY PROTEIN: histamine H4 receptor-like [Pomacea canaliculata]|uniref:LOW QUALITY PROTEIN: histamine H4 receptor-like n=1 Tax=Pomacea canaliculata TaxID=400727 RepID=UPI000D738D99|nr:LOW QUALITY PROTEIN: histamine H4 receptor-like [Pomacea canaliculata]